MKADALLDAMAAFGSSAEVQVNCINLLGIFALESAADREVILRRSGYDFALRAMADFPDDHRMQEIGCWCLRAMSSSSLFPCLHAHSTTHTPKQQSKRPRLQQRS